MKTSITSKVLLAGAFLSMATISGFAMAQNAQPDPGHPRVNEIDNRMTNQANREGSGLTQGQATRDAARDAKINNEATADEAKNGGHLTKREQRKMNRQLNHNNRDIKRQKAKDAAGASTGTTAQ